MAEPNVLSQKSSSIKPHRPPLPPPSPSPPSFVCESFYHRLQVTPDDLIGKPLARCVHGREGG